MLAGRIVGASLLLLSLTASAQLVRFDRGVPGKRVCRDAAPYERGTLLGPRLGHSERSAKQRK